MSYAIIRNQNYTRDRLNNVFKHNKRLNKSYRNKEIDLDRKSFNYCLKQSTLSFIKSFDKIKKEYNLKGQIKKSSNIVCEYIITSGKEYFESVGEEERKRYFIESYNFVKEYKKLGEEYIISADIHMDEEKPHMHLIYIPVIHTEDKQGNKIDKIACSEFWKGRNSYKELQDSFYNFIIEKGFDLERGKSGNKIANIDIHTFKEITKYNKTKELKKENEHLKNKINELNNYINKVLDIAINIFKIPKDIFKSKLFNKGDKSVERL